MDEALEQPRAQQATSNDPTQEEDHSSGEEDGGLDWTKLPKLGAARPVIPKRGEKDFEPAPGGGSGLQLHVLDRARGAMFEALRATRSISSKSISYGIWYPSIARVHVTTARGIHFSTMGHSVARSGLPTNLVGSQTTDAKSNDASRVSKRLELLPEEAIYLIERGALSCYKQTSHGPAPSDPPSPEESSTGAPMSVQQAFAEMIGCENMTLERYQVYAYLKRLGFVLMRAEPPTADYPVAPPLPLSSPRSQLDGRTIWERLKEFFLRFVSDVLNIITVSIRKTNSWWNPLRLDRFKSHAEVFRVMRIIPYGHSVPLHPPQGSMSKRSISPSSPTTPPSPYKVFFHVYKPSTPFRKTSPPPPDFYVVIVNARTTPMPSLHELTALFNALPEMPLPPPRRRRAQAPAAKPANGATASPSPTAGSTNQATQAPSKASSSTLPPDKVASTPIPYSFFYSLLSYLPFRLLQSKHPSDPSSPPPKSSPGPNRPNPFLALKTGTKTIVIAAVDSGNISFFRFGEGVFGEWPMT
ncbi:tRNA-splicing endonuclease subunit sen54 N-term-domain-containing protein [Phlebopus sp. FC_14]|nr:tRNA-splicing endonuclease subunit sen54 N-term-domain-containing protein [Phlebopus sp. FC_14]